MSKGDFEAMRVMKDYISNHGSISHGPQSQASVVPIVDDLMSAATLSQTHLIEPKVIIPGLLRERETVLFIGRPKIGKSRFLEQLALSLSSADSFLGLDVQFPCRVLYLDLENGPFTARERFLRLSAQKHADLERVILYVPDSLAVDRARKVDTSAQGFNNLQVLVKMASPDVLIVDTYRLLAIGSENKAETVLHDLKLLSSLRKLRPRLTIVLVHHTHKAGHENPLKLSHSPSEWVQMASGHYSLVGHCDTTLGMDREASEDGSESIWFGGVSRNFKPPLLLLADCPDLGYKRLEGENALTATMSKVEKRVYELAKAFSVSFSFSEINSSTNVKDRIVGATLKKCLNFNVLNFHEGRYYWMGGTNGGD